MPINEAEFIAKMNSGSLSVLVNLCVNDVLNRPINQIVSAEMMVSLLRPALALTIEQRSFRDKVIREWNHLETTLPKGSVESVLPAVVVALSILTPSM